MKSLRNNITLIGNMGAKANITRFDNGSKVARFRLATNERGNITNWHSVFAWGQLATFIEEYGDKGRELTIHGRLVNRTYMSKDGQPRKITEVELKHVIGMD